MNINSRFTGAWLQETQPFGNPPVFASLHGELLAAGVSDDQLKNIDSIMFQGEGNPAVAGGALIRTTNGPAGFGPPGIPQAQFVIGPGGSLGPFECTYEGLLALEITILPGPAAGNGVWTACSSTQTPGVYRSLSSTRKS